MMKRYIILIGFLMVVVALAAQQIALFGHTHLVGLTRGIGQLGRAYPWVGLTQLGVGDALVFGPVYPTGNTAGNVNSGIGHRLVQVLARKTVAVALGILHQQLVSDDAKHIS